ncbi:hypothetical protein MNB_SV-10-1421 [hydrothermal vent metagenome]|uniref:Uncharacterized protein n=1 Tax=hydrothermal vent metagenome TaxID=652676 RepID=A0A1W1CHU2_9ZZZZ
MEGYMFSVNSFEKDCIRYLIQSNYRERVLPQYYLTAMV